MTVRESARLLVLPPCCDPRGHNFKADQIRTETAVCERCGLIRKRVIYR
ncbi:hypothetical protein PROPHIGD62-2_41 [Mycobacterium phage prophi62-2]|nr:hypothetical protein PROPHIGD11-3_40 [Mycobacterium phage prophiGD11-3]QSM03457.1 hypothetical protein PROPHIGD62-2_41 [Mycobacterium phage prophi62-2]QSM04559.1 hypothetical protein PROPHIGD08-3_36 [Mycobacterium phage prophiGD08-3]